MKKVEAMQLAIDRSRLLMEYIDSMISNSDLVNAKIEIGCEKYNGEIISTFDIYVPHKDFERHFRTDIPSQHAHVLIKQILDDILNKYIESESIGLGSLPL